MRRYYSKALCWGVALCSVSALAKDPWHPGKDKCYQEPKAPSGYELSLSKTATIPLTTDGLVWLKDLYRAGEAQDQAPLAYAIITENILPTADRLLSQSETYSVTYKTTTPPSGNKKDYMTTALYWWQNPQGEYVPIDGCANPEVLSTKYDKRSAIKLQYAVHHYALAYYFTGKPRYGQAASELLDIWFLDPRTAQNPHLSYAQSVPGKYEGRKYGIIETSKFIDLVFYAKLLNHQPEFDLVASQPPFSDIQYQELQGWFSRYISWLTSSQLGLGERVNKNNHGTWFDAQLLYFADFIANPKSLSLVYKTLTHATVTYKGKTYKISSQDRLDQQADMDGYFRHERRRSRPLYYSAYNTQAFVIIAMIAQKHGLDLWRAWDYKLLRAFNVVEPFLAPENHSKWPDKQDFAEDLRFMIPTLRYVWQLRGDEKDLKTSWDLLQGDNKQSIYHVLAWEPGL